MDNSERLELLGTMVDIVEDWLEGKGITINDIPCEDRDRAAKDGEEGLAIIYGEDYDYLTGEFEDLMIHYGLIDDGREVVPVLVRGMYSCNACGTELYTTDRTCPHCKRKIDWGKYNDSD